MKPKQNNKNKAGKNSNKRLKQQQQQPEIQHEAGVSKDLTRNDDVATAETTDVMTSSIVEQSAETTQNVERHIPADNNSDNQSSVHSPGGDAADDHVTSRCADDVISDVEVADILHAAPAVNPDLGVGEAITSDPGVTEVIMSKTFTESTHPGREFVPIRRDDDVIGDVTVQPLPVDAATTLTVRCELVSQPETSFTSGDGRHAVTSSDGAAAETTSGSGRHPVTSSDELRSARGQLKDLTSEFRHLQSLLDSMTSPGADHVVDSDSEEDLVDDDTARVVYRYHLHQQPAAAACRRWIKRDDIRDTSRTEQTQEQRHETYVEEDNSQRVEEQTAKRTVQIDTQHQTGEQRGQTEAQVRGGGGPSVEELGMVDAQQGLLETHRQGACLERGSPRVEEQSVESEEIDNQQQTGDIVEEHQGQTEAHQQ